MEEILSENLLSAEQAADLVGLHPATLRKLAWQRRIRSYKILGCLRFRRRDLEKLVVERPARDGGKRSGV